jgi:hypothetical protein
MFLIFIPLAIVLAVAGVITWRAKRPRWHRSIAIACLVVALAVLIPIVAPSFIFGFYTAKCQHEPVAANNFIEQTYVAPGQKGYLWAVVTASRFFCTKQEAESHYYYQDPSVNLPY